MNYFVYPFRVHIDDTDYSGFVFHTNYIKYMERARSEWFLSAGFINNTKDVKEGTAYFAVHSLSIEYLKPMRLHEQIEVVTSLKKIGRASLIFDQYLRLASRGAKIFCKAEIKIAYVSDKMRPIPLPESSFLTSIRRQLT